MISRLFLPLACVPDPFKTPEQCARLKSWGFELEELEEQLFEREPPDQASVTAASHVLLLPALWTMGMTLEPRTRRLNINVINLHDEKNRPRGQFFPQSLVLVLFPRFEIDPCVNLRQLTTAAIDNADGSTVWTSHRIDPDPGVQGLNEWDAKREKIASAWLNDSFPEWRDVTAYW